MVHIPKTFKEALDELNRHAEDADVGAAEQAYATCWKFMNSVNLYEVYEFCELCEFQLPERNANIGRAPA